MASNMKVAFNESLQNCKKQKKCNENKFYGNSIFVFRSSLVSVNLNRTNFLQSLCFIFSEAFSNVKNFRKRCY